jgi:Holliday junction resolvase-like predicted endonuclease
MRTQAEIRILELTRGGRRISTDELADSLHIGLERLNQKLDVLSEKKAVSYSEGMVEMSNSQRIMLAEQLIHSGYDPQKVSRFLEWQEFEQFVGETLERNGFRTIKHLVFKSRIGRREIDLLAWNDSFLLAIDCKHWLRGLSPSRSRQVASAQAERSQALAERLDTLKKHGVSNAEKHSLMPMILCLVDPRESIVNGVPIVAVSKLISFLYGVSPIDEKLRRIPVKVETGQSLLM